MCLNLFVTFVTSAVTSAAGTRAVGERRRAPSRPPRPAAAAGRGAQAALLLLALILVLFGTGCESPLPGGGGGGPTGFGGGSGGGGGPRVTAFVAVDGTDPAAGALGEALPGELRGLAAGAAVRVLTPNPAPRLPPTPVWQAELPSGLSAAERTARLRQMGDASAAAVRGSRSPRGRRTADQVPLRDLYAILVQEAESAATSSPEGGVRRWPRAQGRVLFAASLRTVAEELSRRRTPRTPHPGENPAPAGALPPLGAGGAPARLVVFLQDDLPYEMPVDAPPPGSGGGPDGSSGGGGSPTRRCLERVQAEFASWGVRGAEVRLVPPPPPAADAPALRSASEGDDPRGGAPQPEPGVPTANTTDTANTAVLRLTNGTDGVDLLTLNPLGGRGSAQTATLRPGATVALRVAPGLYEVRLTSGHGLFPPVVRRGRFRPGQVYPAHYGVGGDGPPLRFGDPE